MVKFCKDNQPETCNLVKLTKISENYVIKHCDVVYECVKNKYYENWYCPFKIWRLP